MIEFQDKHGPYVGIVVGALLGGWVVFNSPILMPAKIGIVLMSATMGLVAGFIVSRRSKQADKP